jgi:hypothetical protein
MEGSGSVPLTNPDPGDPKIYGSAPLFKTVM